MSDENDTQGIETSYITITRTFYPDRDANSGDVIDVETSDGLLMVESLGLLEFAKAHLIAPLIMDPPPESDDE
ncbi:hypothetical protein [Williamsia phyllosphaerae]|uniref:DUF2283 domain-containing protein n=1 Tax=Williamsia phyllosphaerae TaxID=885042 RepID=A0ABQ1V747_9NOCA|nr:hypothetical protein [Williamsia phyllosphaerae]GGF39000.1 hypothetical protein GCM10007298_38380 [Williamsia phyllosphaerae]